jgi:hypothetical protein
MKEQSKTELLTTIAKGILTNETSLASDIWIPQLCDEFEFGSPDFPDVPDDEAFHIFDGDIEIVSVPRSGSLLTWTKAITRYKDLRRERMLETAIHTERETLLSLIGAASEYRRELMETRIDARIDNLEKEISELRKSLTQVAES